MNTPPRPAPSGPFERRPASVDPTRMLAAGLALIAVLVLTALAGIALGHAAGSAVLGGFVGGTAGLFLAFLAVFRWFVKPLRDQMMANDYSHLEPKLDD